MTLAGSGFACLSSMSSAGAATRAAALAAAASRISGSAVPDEALTRSAVVQCCSSSRVIGEGVTVGGFLVGAADELKDTSWARAQRPTVVPR